MQPTYKIKSLRELPKILKKEPQIKTILFDLGDTLYISNNPGPWQRKRDEELTKLINKKNPKINLSLQEYVLITRMILEKMNRERRRTFKELKMEVSAKKILKALCGKLNSSLFKEFIRLYQNYNLAALKKKKDAQPTLRLLAKKGYRLGAVTNTWHSQTHVEDLLKKFGFRKFLKVVIVSSEIGSFKPNPKIFKKALEEFKAKPQETIFVGNEMETDIYGAKNVGMKTVLLK